MSIGRDIRCHQMGEKTLLNVPISAPSLAVSLQLQSVGGEGLAVEWLGHDTPVRANSPPSFDEQNAAEKIVLHIEEIETPQVARLINAAKMHGVHLNTACHVARNCKNAPVRACCCSLFENHFAPNYQICCNNENASG